MHLADIHGVIAALAQPGDPVGILGLQPGLIAVNAVRVDVLARDDAVARGTANSPLGESTAEGYAAGGQAVDIRRDHVVVTQAAERIPTLLVGDDQDDIGGRGRGTISTLLGHKLSSARRHHHLGLHRIGDKALGVRDPMQLVDLIRGRLPLAAKNNPRPKLYTGQCQFSLCILL